MSEGQHYQERWAKLYRRLAAREDHVGLPTRKVAFVTTERCGSSFFCNVLEKTGYFGIPEEYFGMKYINCYSKTLGDGDDNVDFSAYLDFLFRKTTSPNGIFSVKIHAYHHSQMKKQGLDLFDLGFDAVYRIVRRDKIAQAYSFAKADMSKAWQSGDKPLRSDVQISPMKLLEYLGTLANYDAYIEENMQKFVSETFYYEDFNGYADPGIFRQVFRENGCPEDLPLETSLGVQSNDRDRVEIQKFKSWMGVPQAA